MSYNTKNYTKQGGDETHFGGKVVFEEGVVVEGGSFTAVPTATTEVKGIVKVGSGLSVTADGVLSANIPDAGANVKGLVKQAEAVADAAGDAPTAEEYNALLAALRAAGIIATPEAAE